MALWDTFESRLIINATLRAETAMRIGAGGDDAAHPSASDLPVLRGADDQPYIPGSSLRGVVRSQVERIVRTLEPVASAGQGACNPTDNRTWCIQAERMEVWRQALRGGTAAAAKDTNGSGTADAKKQWWQEATNALEDANSDVDKALADLVWGQSCRVCRAFGNAWLAARIRMADLHLQADSMVGIERRDGVAIDRDKETVQHKYDFEIIPRAASFNLQITAENLAPAERGLLWLGLRELMDGHVLLGGFKGRGLGRAGLQQLAIQMVDAADRQALRRYLLNRAMSDVTPAIMDEWLAVLLQEVGLEAE